MKNPILFLTMLALCPALASYAQIAPANAQGVAMGHLHFFVKDVDAYKKMFVAMGGVAITHNSGVKFPGAIMYIREGNSNATPMDGSVVNHVGFIVPDVTAARAAWKAAGIKTEDGTIPHQFYVDTPDGLLQIEILEDKTLSVPVAFHHIHFFVADPPTGGSGVKDMQAWYAKVFGAIPGMRSRFDAAALPGVSLTFSKVDKPTTPTEGHNLDHIGFEVNDLQAFCEKETTLGVKFDTTCQKAPDKKNLNVFLTDPWGTKIELTSDMREF